jgi:hypothetical protein
MTVYSLYKCIIGKSSASLFVRLIENKEKSKFTVAFMDGYCYNEQKYLGAKIKNGV